MCDTVIGLLTVSARQDKLEMIFNMFEAIFMSAKISVCACFWLILNPYHYHAVLDMLLAKHMIKKTFEGFYKSAILL